jgi:glycosyltransferase involved in cell wall biosynthesis
MNIENNCPLVSIITVSFNSEKHIEKTIRSVLNQSYNNIEYIIIDGGSSDNTNSIIETYKSKFGERLKFLSEQDNGIYDAMNKGINLAEGEFIGIINSDDYYFDNNVVSNMVNHFLKSESDIIHGNIMVIDETDNHLYPEIGSYNLKGKMKIKHPSCFVRRRCYQELGLFNIDFKIIADYELLLRFSKKNIKFDYVDEIIACYRIGGASSNNAAVLKEKRKLYNKYFSPIYSTVFYYKELSKSKLKSFLRKIIGNKQYNNLKMKKNNNF